MVLQCTRLTPPSDPIPIHPSDMVFLLISLISVLTESSTWLATFLLGYVTTLDQKIARVISSDQSGNTMMVLRWAVTVTSGVCAYPLDSVKRRMMMTAGEEVIKVIFSLLPPN